MSWSSRTAVVALCLAVATAGVPPPLVDAEDATSPPGVVPHHHPIATTNAEAQRFFDYGLTLIFGFNHDEAVRAFRRAADVDPKAAMPHWGIALALGPNINLDVDPERERAASAAIERAQSLGRGAPQPERDYIEALSRRYSPHPTADLKALAVEYSVAMGELSKRYPDDLDAATLYAESLMDLRPWRLWNADGTPAEGTEVIVAVLESVLRRDPEHIGANHYYIHAVEASRQPERALGNYELALHANPKFTNARINYAILLQQEGYTVDALAQYEIALQETPNDASIHLTAATLYARDRETKDKARQHYQTFLKLSPNSPLARDVRRWLDQNR